MKHLREFEEWSDEEFGDLQKDMKSLGFTNPFLEFAEEEGVEFEGALENEYTFPKWETILSEGKRENATYLKSFLDDLIKKSEEETDNNSRMVKRTYSYYFFNEMLCDVEIVETYAEHKTAYTDYDKPGKKGWVAYVSEDHENRYEGYYFFRMMRDEANPEDILDYIPNLVKGYYRWYINSVEEVIRDFIEEGHEDGPPEVISKKVDYTLNEIYELGGYKESEIEKEVESGKYDWGSSSGPENLEYDFSIPWEKLENTF
jgi:hypothetical protein